MPTYRNISSKAVIVDGKTVNPGETVATLTILNAPEFEKVSDEPYYPLAKAVHEVEATEIGITPADGITLTDKNCEYVRVETDVDVMVFPNSVSNPYPYKLTVQEGIIDIRNGGKIEKIYLFFAAAGKVRIIEVP